ncbi:N-6 DNA methylase [Anaerosalibacter massiliensis]|uniref:N-6 DNA methylase n=1 Tax=Anaerosalibacter massiliensis TaxID=1347392 RepID=A0A9X2S4Q8_9FIRM|nr:N-6 DNA methylase [Anaerosalibacter massiliensis]MCR2043544.1 N-6 DNA methylase [Anaerosalibacter massiliensis]
MLSVATNYIKDLNTKAQVEVFVQELNNQSYAICKSDILMKEQRERNIVFGNSFAKDAYKDQKVRFALMNSPFGVNWKNTRILLKKSKETRV